MKLTPEQKEEMIKLWRKNLQGEIEDFSSIEFQTKVWIDKNPNYFWSWDEAYEIYFGDILGIITTRGESYNIKNNILKLIKEGFLTKDEASLVSQFSEKLEKYMKNIDNPSDEKYQEILHDAKWINIIKIAKKLLQKINFEKSPDEN
jgi:hypothetical protein